MRVTIFAEAVAYDETYIKRLVTPFEWPIPSFFAPVRKLVREGRAMVFFEIEDGQLDTLRAAAEAAGGEVTFAQPYAEPRKGPQLSDYTWNHTTLWAIKHDPAWTYLQAGFSRTDARAQFRQLKENSRPNFISTSNLRSGAAVRWCPARSRWCGSRPRSGCRRSSTPAARWA